MNGEPESLVISSQVARQGGAGDIDEVLEENPAIITFSFLTVNPPLQLLIWSLSITLFIFSPWPQRCQ